MKTADTATPSPQSSMRVALLFHTSRPGVVQFRFTRATTSPTDESRWDTLATDTLATLAGLHLSDCRRRTQCPP
jgi:hypothetical protein